MAEPPRPVDAPGRPRRGAFVGRERELEQLRGALDDALAGHGSVVVLAGEPGIGKTWMLQELEAEALQRGAEVLWGRSRDVGGAPPYWPWTQILEALVGSAVAGPHRATLGGLEGLRALLGESADIIAPLAPRLAETTGPRQPAGESESARFQLFIGVELLLKAVANVTPVVLLFDDLQRYERPPLGSGRAGSPGRGTTNGRRQRSASTRAPRHTT